MTFDVEKFVASPTQEELISLKKDELLLIVKHYKLEDIKRSIRKAAICNSLLRYYVGQEIFEESELEFLEETEVGSKSSEQLGTRKLEIEERQKDREIEERQKNREIEERQEKMKYELELRKLEMEERQKSREFKERQKDKELELRNK